MKGRRNLVMGLVGILVLGLNMNIKAEDVYEEWVARYDWANSVDFALAIDMDNNGNIIVTGYVHDSLTHTDYLTIKYSNQGETLWVARYSSLGSSDLPSDLAVDDSGYIYVTGESAGTYTGLDFLTIKYTPSGDTMWIRRYDRFTTDGDTSPPNYASSTTGNEEVPNAIIIDKRYNIYVAGYAFGHGTDQDYALVKYSPIGETLWSRFYNGPGGSTDIAYDVSVDDTGNILVTGYSYGGYTVHNDYATLKYSTNGQLLWTARYNSPTNDYDIAHIVRVSADRHVYIGGSSGIIKYTSDGDFLWVNPGSVADIAFDLAGNTLATGPSSGFSPGMNYKTVKFSALGETLWTQTYDGTAHSFDEVGGLAIDQNGNVYVSGSSMNVGTGYDIVTIKYTSDGDVMWLKKYDYAQYTGAGDRMTGLVVDDKSNTYVTGYSYSTNSSSDYVTIKYSPCLSSSPKAGDANSDDSLSLSDVISTVNYIFGKGGEPRPYPPCDDILFDCWVYNRFCRYDWNGDQKVTLGDCIRAINYVFNKSGGPWNPVPSLGCCPFPQN